MFNFSVKGDLVNYERRIMINKCVFLQLEVEKQLNFFGKEQVKDIECNKFRSNEHKKT